VLPLLVEVGHDGRGRGHTEKDIVARRKRRRC